MALRQIGRSYFFPAAAGEQIPVILGTGDTQIVAVTCRILWARINNPTNGVITVSLRDGNNVYAIPPTDLAPKGWINERFADPGDPCPNGVTINASAAGLHSYVRLEALR